MTEIDPNDASSPWFPLGELRAVPEFGAFVAAAPWLLRAPRGVGRHVLILPGFISGDPPTLPIRGALRALGHRPHGWGLGVNVGPADHVVQGLRRLLQDLARAENGPIDVIGWSLGGVYARILASNRPEHVRQVITVGSPISFRQSQSNITGAFKQMSKVWGFAKTPEGVDLDRIPVPSTAIYSNTDGVVAGGACRQSPGPYAESIEVYASHIGMMHNPSVVWAIADRLAQVDDEWRPFRPPRMIKRLYPNLTGGLASVPDTAADAG